MKSKASKFWYVDVWNWSHAHGEGSGQSEEHWWGEWVVKKDTYEVTLIKLTFFLILLRDQLGREKKKHESLKLPLQLSIFFFHQIFHEHLLYTGLVRKVWEEKREAQCLVSTLLNS